jgi:predicted NBD/HSP70 family sugar kinase
MATQTPGGRHVLKVPAPLDPDFYPAIQALQEARRRTRGSVPVGLALERDGGSVFRFDVPSVEPIEDDASFRLVERVVKFMLWGGGGWRLMVAGPEWLCRRLRAEYATGGARTFDAEFMGRIYGRALTIEPRAFTDLPPAADASMAAGGHLDGCRIGFDLGASDFKISAVKHGEVVFSEEFPWEPRVHADPEYHYRKLNEGLRLAAGHLPRVDAIGGSSAGVVVANQIQAASLFRAVSEARFGEARNLFLRIQKEWQVPVEVANDGDVTALAGAMSLGVSAILGVAMGSSEAGGYLDRKGRLTGRMTELAFAPVDLNPQAAADEWSGDRGVGAMYFSQQAVNKLAPAAGLAFEEAMPLPERLKVVQNHMAAGDDRALRIYETIGVYLGYTVPWYREYYDFDHLLILGRVTSGRGGETILSKAQEVLRLEFPEWGGRLNVSMPDERARRVGQSAAAASLPRLEAMRT